MSSSVMKRPLGLTLFAVSFVALWVVISIFPFLWTIWGSFKIEADFFSKADWRNAIYGVYTTIKTGSAFTMDAYYATWVKEGFGNAFMNTAVVVFFVVTISMTFGTLGGYALARSGYKYAFFLLILALVFRAMPHITLVSGYMLPFFEWGIWGKTATTIVVLVAINQPFTLWMLHSFFVNIPKELDESAMVDGCTHFGAFYRVIIPVMWPGFIATALFSFLLAYNDFAVTSLLLSEENRTMVPAINAFLGTNEREGYVMYAVAAVVPTILPLFFLVMFFQKYIISGLTAGSVKG